jgi:hypothetical protein
MEAAVRKAEQSHRMNLERRFPIVSSGVGGRIPTGRLTLTPTGSDPQYVYLDRDTHENRILFYAPSVPLNVYLPASPTVGDTYRFVFGGTEKIYFKMQNDNHVLCGPFESLLFSADMDELRITHASWFNPWMGPGSGFFYQKEMLGFFDINTSEALLQWFVLTYTGRESQVSDGFIDTDGDGEYWDPAWLPPETPVHPLTYKTCTEWMVIQAHGFCRLLINSGEQSETPF